VTSCLTSLRNNAANRERPEQVKASVIFDIAIADWDHRDCLAGDNLNNDISKWLSPPDPWKNHHLACKSRHRQSAAWFTQGNTFSEWKASEATSSLLWVYGKRSLMHSSYAFAETEVFPFRSGRGKKRFLVLQAFDIPFSGTYRVG
jgi:hypothetical protein